MIAQVLGRWPSLQEPYFAFTSEFVVVYEWCTVTCQHMEDAFQLVKKREQGHLLVWSGTFVSTK
jgi:hypothetical protein